MTGSRLKTVGILTAFVFLALIPGFSESAPRTKRGLFVTAILQDPPVLSSRGQITRLVDFAKKSGISDIFVQVYRANRSWFPCQVADSTPYADCYKNLSEDPLAFLIRQAHKSGIKVHAWLNLLSLSGNQNAPLLRKYGTDILTRNLKPKKSLADYKIDNQYFLEPGDPRVRDALGQMVEELLNAYAGLDGVLFDYIRYPDRDPFYGYTPANISRFKKASGLQAIEDQGLAWKDWKRKQVTELLELLAKKTRSLRPEIRVAATGCLPYSRAIHEAFQDWPGWLEKGIVDSVTIMDYSPDPKEYADWIETARSKVKDFSRLDIGVPAYKLLNQPQIFKEEYLSCRNSGCGECVVFHYGNLLDSSAMARTVSSK